MNGFMSPRLHRAGSVSARSLFALIVASWLGFNFVSAQDTEGPSAPPALPRDEAEAPAELFFEEVAPAPKPVIRPKVRPSSVKPLPTRGRWSETTQPIPTGRPEGETSYGRGTGRFGETTHAIPTQASRLNTVVRQPKAQSTSVWAEPVDEEIETPAQPIRQTQALIPQEGLEVEPIEGSEPIEARREAASFEPGQESSLEEAPLLEEPAQELPRAEASEFEVAPDAPAPLVEEEPISEPAPLNDRVGNPHRLPINTQIDRTAAAELAPYNERDTPTPAAQFGAHDEVHTVAAGESYWTISKKHYGLGRYSAALAEYNKSRIPKPDKIKPGMKVIVPPVETLEQKYESLIFGVAASASKEETQAPVKSGFFVDANGQPMYRVGKGDTLSNIAQDHLGRSSRWTRIVELNRDVLPNPDRMKLGMILRLPADASEAVQAR